MSHKIGIGALVLGISSLASYACGLLRDRLLANTFGAGIELDVYNTAFLIPDLIITLFAAALTSAFVPVFTRRCHLHGSEYGWRLTNHLLLCIGGIMIVSIMLAVILMPWLTHLIAPGFAEEQRLLLVSVNRWMLLSPLLFSISILLGSTLQGLQRFFSYALSPVLYNIGIVIGIWLLTPTFGIYGAVYGVIIGAVLHMTIRWIELYRAGWSLRYTPQHTWLGVQETIRLMIPRAISLLAIQGNLWIYNALASTLAVGSITVFNLARNFQSLPVSLFGIALATALFPALAHHYAKGQGSHFREATQKSLNHILFFTLPAAVGIAILAHPLITIFLGGGEFSSEAIALTSFTLILFSFSIPLESIQHVLARSFYAQHDTITPVIIGIIALGVNWLVSIFTIRYWGVGGLAIGFGAVMFTHVVLLSWRLHRRIPGIFTKNFWLHLLPMFLASAVMGVSIKFSILLINSTILQLSLGTMLGAILYLLLAWLFRMPEIRSVTLLFWRLLPQFK